MASFNKVQANGLDPLSLPAVVHALQRPLSLDAIESRIATQVDSLWALTATRTPDDLRIISRLVRETLDLPPGVEPAALESASDTMTRYADLPDDARALVSQMRVDWSIQTEFALDHLKVIQFAGEHAHTILAATLERLTSDASEWERLCLAMVVPGEPVGDADLPDGFRDVVAGDVYRVRTEPDGRWSVYGGPGPNRYITDRLAFVYDIGGDDTYRAGNASFDDNKATNRDSAITDIAGNDAYITDRSFCLTMSSR
ncbi:MAG: hypothetical protein AAGB34_09355 [Planctomycetota bacterium]